MREISWYSEEDFNFGKKDHRVAMCGHQEFTYGHYKVGPGFATICGARMGDRLFYGVTFCSPENNFSKEEGRRYARLNLFTNDYSYMRGVMSMTGLRDDIQPAQALKLAVDIHLAKMKKDVRPQWSKGATVAFRGKRRIGEVTTYDLLNE